MVVAVDTGFSRLFQINHIWKTGDVNVSIVFSRVSQKKTIIRIKEEKKREENERVDYLFPREKNIKFPSKEKQKKTQERASVMHWKIKTNNRNKF